MSAHLPVKAKARSITCVQRRSAHRIRGTTCVVGTGGAVRPLTLCLSAQGPRCTDPTIAPAFDGLKISVSRRILVLSTAPCSGRHSLDPVTRGSTGVSAHRVSAVPHSQGVTGRSKRHLLRCLVSLFIARIFLSTTRGVSPGSRHGVRDRRDEIRHRKFQRPEGSKGPTDPPRCSGNSRARWTLEGPIRA